MVERAAMKWGKVAGSNPSDFSMHEGLIASWESAVQGLALCHADPEVRVSLTVVPRPRAVRILFTLHNLQDSTKPSRIEAFEYYFYADHFPGFEKAKVWVLSAWALLMEHEELEMSGADPHHSDECAAHRALLDKRHDMEFMLTRILG
jgi:hypothetical protein